MIFLLQALADAFKSKFPGSFYENGFTMKILILYFSKKTFGCRKEMSFRNLCKPVAVFIQLRAYPDKFVDFGRFNHLNHTTVKLIFLFAALFDVRQDECFLLLCRLFFQQVQGNGKRVDIGIITVVNYCTIVNAFDLF